MESEASDEAAAYEALVEQGENARGVGGKAGGGADCADDEGGEHAGFDAFSGYIADDEEETAVGGVRQDLKEVSADLAGGAVLAGD